MLVKVVARGHTEELPRVGGALCLDLTNTIDYRREPRRRDFLPDYASLLRWTELGGAIEPDLAAAIARRASRASMVAGSVHGRAIAFREALYRALTALATSSVPADPDMRLIADEISASWNAVDLTPSQGAVERRPQPVIEAPLAVAAQSAMDLLTTAPLDRLHACPGCGWLFLDTTRNRSRVWCTMAVCGNRAKTTRFANRQRQRRDSQ